MAWYWWLFIVLVIVGLAVGLYVVLTGGDPIESAEVINFSTEAPITEVISGSDVKLRASGLTGNASVELRQGSTVIDKQLLVVQREDTLEYRLPEKKHLLGVRFVLLTSAKTYETNTFDIIPTWNLNIGTRAWYVPESLPVVVHVDLDAPILEYQTSGSNVRPTEWLPLNTTTGLAPDPTRGYLDKVYVHVRVTSTGNDPLFLLQEVECDYHKLIRLDQSQSNRPPLNESYTYHFYVPKCYTPATEAGKLTFIGTSFNHTLPTTFQDANHLDWAMSKGSGTITQTSDTDVLSAVVITYQSTMKLAVDPYITSIQYSGGVSSDYVLSYDNQSSPNYRLWRYKVVTQPGKSPVKKVVIPSGDGVDPNEAALYNTLLPANGNEYVFYYFTMGAHLEELYFTFELEDGNTVVLAVTLGSDFPLTTLSLNFSPVDNHQKKSWDSLLYKHKDPYQLDLGIPHTASIKAKLTSTAIGTLTESTLSSSSWSFVPTLLGGPHTLKVDFLVEGTDPNISKRIKTLSQSISTHLMLFSTLPLPILTDVPCYVIETTNTDASPSVTIATGGDVTYVSKDTTGVYTRFIRWIIHTTAVLTTTTLQLKLIDTSDTSLTQTVDVPVVYSGTAKVGMYERQLYASRSTVQIAADGIVKSYDTIHGKDGVSLQGFIMPMTWEIASQRTPAFKVFIPDLNGFLSNYPYASTIYDAGGAVSTNANILTLTSQGDTYRCIDAQTAGNIDYKLFFDHLPMATRVGTKPAGGPSNYVTGTYSYAALGVETLNLERRLFPTAHYQRFALVDDNSLMLLVDNGCYMSIHNDYQSATVSAAVSGRSRMSVTLDIEQWVPHSAILHYSDVGSYFVLSNPSDTRSDFKVYSDLEISHPLGLELLYSATRFTRARKSDTRTGILCWIGGTSEMYVVLSDVVTLYSNGSPSSYGLHNIVTSITGPSQWTQLSGSQRHLMWIYNNTTDNNTTHKTAGAIIGRDKQVTWLPQANYSDGNLIQSGFHMVDTNEVSFVITDTSRYITYTWDDVGTYTRTSAHTLHNESIPITDSARTFVFDKQDTKFRVVCYLHNRLTMTLHQDNPQNPGTLVIDTTFSDGFITDVHIINHTTVVVRLNSEKVYVAKDFEIQVTR